MTRMMFGCRSLPLSFLASSAHSHGTGNNKKNQLSRLCLMVIMGGFYLIVSVAGIEAGQNGTGIGAGVWALLAWALKPKLLKGLQKLLANPLPGRISLLGGQRILFGWVFGHVKQPTVVVQFPILRSYPLES